jgi:hypothetical protein
MSCRNDSADGVVERFSYFLIVGGAKFLHLVPNGSFPHKHIYLNSQTITTSLFFVLEKMAPITLMQAESTSYFELKSSSDTM